MCLQNYGAISVELQKHLDDYMHHWTSLYTKKQVRPYLNSFKTTTIETTDINNECHISPSFLYTYQNN